MQNVRADWQSIKVELYEMNMQNMIEEVKQYVDTCKMTKFGACYDPDIFYRRIGARGTPKSPCLRSLPEGRGLPFPRLAAGDADACIHPHPPAIYCSFR